MIISRVHKTGVYVVCGGVDGMCGAGVHAEATLPAALAMAATSKGGPEKRPVEKWDKSFWKLILGV